jgi:hypothetical protein|tara:strand:- start:778 stop:1275 length:498 start_codon:yes stop_codon:yes gene_type:complete
MSSIKNLFNKKFFILFPLVLIIGINTYFNKSELRYNIIDFTIKNKIFIDRNYIDSSENKFFLKRKLIQIPRHHNKKINILTNSKLIIYRPSCSKNINDFYKVKWKVYKYDMHIEGFTCVHKKIYFKEFNTFLLTLEPGGPVAADPIFVEIVKNGGFIKILNKKLQ